MTVSRYGDIDTKAYSERFLAIMHAIIMAQVTVNELYILKND
ncbi:hypothetical protein C7475_101169 [Chitinophaga sp. S165]|nr:hypothetical protein C7475_101169 [Chitinophaga sp. S165]